MAAIHLHAACQQRVTSVNDQQMHVAAELIALLWARLTFARLILEY